MMSIEKVCVDFLFAGRNPTHSEQACAFLREQGFQTFCLSHEPTHDEALSWRRNVLNACLSGTFNEHRKEIEAAVENYLSVDQVKFVSGSGLEMANDYQHLSSSLFAPCAMLKHFYQQAEYILYLGIEKWALLEPKKTEAIVSSPWGPLMGPSAKHTELEVQPTSEIIINEFGELALGPNELGFEPGPMTMGRALRPTAFDCLLSHEKDEVLSNYVTPTGISRLMDTLQAMQKGSPVIKDTSPSRAIDKIHREIIDRIGLQLIIGGMTKFPLLVTGVFAPLLFQSLKERWPEIQWQLCPYSREVQGLATAGARCEK